MVTGIWVWWQEIWVLPHSENGTNWTWVFQTARKVLAYYTGRKGNTNMSTGLIFKIRGEPWTILWKNDCRHLPSGDYYYWLYVALLRKTSMFANINSYHCCGRCKSIASFDLSIFTLKLFSVNAELAKMWNCWTMSSARLMAYRVNVVKAHLS